MQVIKVVPKTDKKNIKITTYCRVSRNTNEQFGSIEIQGKYFENKINSNSILGI